VLPYHIAKLTQLLQEWRLLEIDRRVSRDHADAGHLRPRLRVSAERRQEHAEGERDNAPDRAAPHGGALSSTSGIPLVSVDTTNSSSHGHLPTTQDVPLYSPALSFFSSRAAEAAERYIGCKSGHYI